MLDLQSIQDMIADSGMFLELLGYKRLEETRRTGSDLADKKFSEFKIFHGLCGNDNLKAAYQSMQRNYIFSEKDLLPLDFVIGQWEKLERVLMEL